MSTEDRNGQHDFPHGDAFGAALDRSLSRVAMPPPSAGAHEAAINAAMDAFNAAQAEKLSAQGSDAGARQTLRKQRAGLMEWLGGWWKELSTMQRKQLMGGVAVAAIATVLVPSVILLQQKSAPEQGWALTAITADVDSAYYGRVIERYNQAEPSRATPNEPARKVAEREQSARQKQEAISGKEARALANLSAAPAAKSPIGATTGQASNQPASPSTIADFKGGRVEEQVSRVASVESKDVQQPEPQYFGEDKFKEIEINPIKVATEEPVSTFSIDVDTAAYSFIRRQLNHGVLPQKDAVRIEEMVNYFDYHYPPPDSAEQPFQPTVAVYDSPWNAKAKIMHIGIKGLELSDAEKPRSNLVFLLDTSGSMSSPDKLPLLQQSMRMLLDELDPDDTVAIVVYAGSAGAVLEPTPVKNKRKILNAINNLQAGGSTAGGEGIRLAYELARENFDKDAVNRVILGTDGDFNVGITNPQELKGFIERERETGVFLSVLGFGEGNYNDALMQELAQNGNGVAAYLDTVNEARKVLVTEANSSLFTIAKDVKIQVEFNPAQVSEYRLIGYESRMLNREDFNNDKVDAGDIGSGHTVTALYEYIPTGNADAKRVDELRYGAASKSLSANDQRAVETTAEGSAEPDTLRNKEIAFLKIRYKLPNEDKSHLITRPITAADDVPFDQASDDVRFAASVAGFGQLLRGGRYITDGFDYDRVIDIANNAKGKDEFGYRTEFVQLVRAAKHADDLQRQPGLLPMHGSPRE